MDDLTALATQLKAVGLGAGLDSVGIAPAAPFASTRQVLERRRSDGLAGGMAFTYRNPQRSTDPSNVVAGARAIVVGARAYRRQAPHESPDRTAPQSARRRPPRAEVARYSWIDHYVPLRQALEEIAGHLRQAGWQARVVADDNALVDREAAFRAGLGWYGKNTMLLLHGHGSEFVLGSVVTDAPLPTGPQHQSESEPTAPAEAAETGCGPCTRCLPACPTGALVEPGVLDARRCLAWLLQDEGVFPRQHRVALGGRIYGCDECQEVCPPNRLEIRRRPPPPAEDGAEAAVDLVGLLLDDDDEALLERHGRWYIPRRQPRYLRRNALVALGNIGDGHDATVAAALELSLAADDPIVRAHAVWAASRLGRDDMIEPLRSTESDPTVVAELQALPGPRPQL